MIVITFLNSLIFFSKNNFSIIFLANDFKIMIHTQLSIVLTDYSRYHLTSVINENQYIILDTEKLLIVNALTSSNVTKLSDK